MIICSCNNISDKQIITKFKSKCGKCKSMTEHINKSEILKIYEKYSLLHKEEDGYQIYDIYEGFILVQSFKSTDNTAYKLARDYFDSLKGL